MGGGKRGGEGQSEGCRRMLAAARLVQRMCQLTMEKRMQNLKINDVSRLPVDDSIFELYQNCMNFN